jgi:hypothetical protein
VSLLAKTLVQIPHLLQMVWPHRERAHSYRTLERRQNNDGDALPVAVSLLAMTAVNPMHALRLTLLQT